MGRDSLNGINTHSALGAVYFAVNLKEHWMNCVGHRRDCNFTEAESTYEDYKESLKSDALIAPLTLIEWND